MDILVALSIIVCGYFIGWCAGFLVGLRCAQKNQKP
jgi:hypothetical protein